MVTPSCDRMKPSRDVCTPRALPDQWMTRYFPTADYALERESLASRDRLCQPNHLLGVPLGARPWRAGNSSSGDQCDARIDL